MREQQFHSEKVGYTFETTHATIDVVTEEYKVASCESHSKSPNIVAKEMQIFEVAMDVAKYVCWALQEGYSRFTFQHLLDFVVEFDEIFCKLFSIQVIEMTGWIFEHVYNPLRERMRRILILHLLQNTPCSKRGIAAHTLSLLCYQLPTRRRLVVFHSHGRRRQRMVSTLALASRQLVRQTTHLLLQRCNLRLFLRQQQPCLGLFPFLF
mmetsp:Transcript_18594/g.27643  ORF Transcript_18594/g.27643 Transcript_18594/m.27643 type:complete len:209 (+) Transcript_18594:768-1394(+)